MMRNKLRIHSLLFSVSYWMLVGFYFVAVRYIGIDPYAPPDLDYGVLAMYAGVVGFYRAIVINTWAMRWS